MPSWINRPIQAIIRNKLWIVIAICIFGGLLIGVSSISGGGSDSSSDSPQPTPSTEAPRVEGVPPSKKPTTPTPSESKQNAEGLEMTASHTTFIPGILSTSGDWTSVEVEITNNTEGTIEVNPLYFYVSDTEGVKQNHALGSDANELQLTTLHPGETANGVITVEGDIEAKYVSFEGYTESFSRIYARADL